MGIRDRLADHRVNGTPAEWFLASAVTFIAEVGASALLAIPLDVLLPIIGFPTLIFSRFGLPPSASTYTAIAGGLYLTVFRGTFAPAERVAESD